MTVIRLFRPISRALSREYSRYKASGVRGTSAILTLIVLVGGTAAAQNLGTARGSDGRGSVRAEVGTVVHSILALRKVGAPVILEDGRYEQRYQITANVMFRLVSSAAHDAEVRCASATREMTLGEYAGQAGFQVDVRVRSGDPAALEINAELLSTAAPAQLLGR